MPWRGGLPALATTAWLLLCCFPGCNFKDPHSEESEADPCRPRSVSFRVADKYSYDGEHDPDCSVDELGRALMRFTPVEGCPSEPNPWRSCLIARHQDISAFAASQGVFEASVCVNGPLPGSLQLKFEYAPDNDGAFQKQLVLTALPSWQNPIGGCQRVVFRADDLSLPEQCRSQNDALECTATPRALESPINSADPELRDAQLLLTTTSCEPARNATAEPVALTLSELRFYPSACFCGQTDECAAGAYCDTDGFAEFACCRCSGDCPGICRRLDTSN